MAKTTTGKHLPGVTSVPSFSEVSNSPFIIKKVEKARATIAKYGLSKNNKSKKGK